MTQYSFTGAGGRGTPAVDPGGQQQSRDGNCSSTLSNSHPVPPESACLFPSEAPIRAVKPHRLNKKDSSCPAYLLLDFLVFSWLLVTGGRQKVPYPATRPKYTGETSCPVCSSAALPSAGQETPETLRSTHLPRCVPEALEQGTGMDDNGG